MFKGWSCESVCEVISHLWIFTLLATRQSMSLFVRGSHLCSVEGKKFSVRMARYSMKIRGTLLYDKGKLNWKMGILKAVFTSSQILPKTKSVILKNIFCAWLLTVCIGTCKIMLVWMIECFLCRLIKHFRLQVDATMVVWSQNSA